MNKLALKAIPFAICLTLLCILHFSEFENPIRYLTNDFYIEGYQATAQPQGNENDKIFIVNISDFSSEEIKDQVEILTQYNPAVIGVDFMPEKSDTISQAIPFKNIILPILIEEDTIQYSINCFSNQAYFGFTQLYSPSYIEPFQTIEGKTYPSFATKIIQQYDSSAYKALLDRENKKEIINYKGNIQNFPYLGDLTTLKTIDALKSIKGKIVLVGYTGIENPFPTISDNYDSHDTPQGKMFGVVLLANTLYTFLGNHINQMPFIWMAVSTSILAMFNIIGANLILTKVRFRYSLIKVLQVFQLVVLFLGASFIIHRFSFSIDYELMAYAIIISPEVTYWYSRYHKL